MAPRNCCNEFTRTRFLQRGGIAVTIANNGREALQLATDQDFDLILMDCKMPEMDGFAATKAVRTLSGQKGQVPIIALTANAFDDDRGGDECAQRQGKTRDLR